MKAAGRLIVDDALEGAINMALDEALLDLRRIPTLRFYRWLRPTLSLGYFQKTDDIDMKSARERGYDLVRRSTGGKAILHQHELTYSLCAPEIGALSGGPAAAMAAVHTAIAAELSVQSSKDVYIRHQRNLFSDKNGSSWCFEDSSPLDICLEQKKLLGSAARRQQGWILFHGSLVLQIPTENPDVAELGFEPDLHAVNSRLADALEIDFQAGDWDISEQTLAASIARQKYAADDFLYKR